MFFNKLNELTMEKDEEINKNENNKKNNIEIGDSLKNVVGIKEDNDIFKRKANKHTSLLDRKLTQNFRNKNNVIQHFIHEYSNEHFGNTNKNTKIKRKNSLKSNNKKLDLDIIYEESDSNKCFQTKSRNKNMNKPRSRKSQFFTLFRKPPERLRRTSVTSPQTKLLMRKPEKSEKNKIHDIVEENQYEDSKNEKSDESDLSESKKSKSEKEKDKYCFSFDDEESNEKSNIGSGQNDSSIKIKSDNESESNNESIKNNNNERDENKEKIILRTDNKNDIKVEERNDNIEKTEDDNTKDDKTENEKEKINLDL